MGLLSASSIHWILYHHLTAVLRAARTPVLAPASGRPAAAAPLGLSAPKSGQALSGQHRVLHLLYIFPDMPAGNPFRTFPRAGQWPSRQSRRRTAPPSAWPVPAWKCRSRWRTARCVFSRITRTMAARSVVISLLVPVTPRLETRYTETPPLPAQSLRCGFPRWAQSGKSKSTPYRRQSGRNSSFSSKGRSGRIRPSMPASLQADRNRSRSVGEHHVGIGHKHHRNGDVPPQLPHQHRKSRRW